LSFCANCSADTLEVSGIGITTSIALGYEITRDITPGEAIVIDRQGNIFTQQCASASKYSPCIFEFVY
jgi:glutamine phosphoribosylpyrophosphate amidotransferase